jgi:hypothetical protein
LGTELLDDLKPQVSPKPSATMAEQVNPSPESTSSPSSPPARFDNLGEDIGGPSGPLPLVRAAQGMQRASALLGESSSMAGTQALTQAGTVQQQVVAQLDQLIEELSKQCQVGQSSRRNQQSQTSQRPQTQAAKSQSSQSRGTTPARDSNDQLNNRTAETADKGDISELAKSLWGHLPQRSREQMRQSFSTEFLPKYELEIEQYYHRLSEEQD